MDPAHLPLTVLPETLAVCRLPADAPVPAWTSGDGLVSLTRTGDELSIVCPAGRVPRGVPAEGGWRAFRVNGAIPFGVTGILAGLSSPLATAGVPIFAISTYDTDYVLVKAADLPRAVSALERAGHAVVEGGA